MITPLFALDAEDLYDAGQFTDAAALCRKGLEHYPEYASGYAVLYRSLIALDQYDDAMNAVLRGLEAMPANRILLRLSAEHEVLMSQFVDDTRDDGEYPTIVQERVSIDEAATPYSEFVETDIVIAMSAEEGDDDDSFEPDAVLSVETPVVSPLSYDISESNIYDDSLVALNDDGSAQDSLSAVDSIIEEHIPEQHSSIRTVYPPLRIIDTKDSTDKVMIRASSVGLIPGLHFAPTVLRTVHHKQGDLLPELPPLKEFAPRHYLSKDKKSVKSRTPLEELAARLERARISIVQEEHIPSSHAGAEIVSTATDTVAKIYESQGALSQAIKVYQQLARSKPEYRDEYEAKIRVLHQKIEEKKLLS